MNEFKIVGNGTVTVGRASVVGDGAQIIFHQPGSVSIGDYCVIAPGVKIVCSGGDVRIGDWTTLHDNCLVLSGKYVNIGQHCWFGQSSVIDGSGGLNIGRGVRVGMYSQIWSHVAAGEQIEGCTLYGERAVTIEDDVWLVGSCIVASGVTVGRRTVALIGSNITKSFPPNITIAGSPAALKSALAFYREIALDEKWQMLLGWLQTATQELALSFRALGEHIVEVYSEQDSSAVVFALRADDASSVRLVRPSSTVCCVEDKSYNKTFSATERRVLKFLSGNKARFYSA
jgi:acetyltransferase-like isoleucine patch superfamily enzyme